MASQWYYLIGDQQHGPVRSKELMRLARHGIVTRETFVWKPGISDWVKASKIKRLFEDEAPPAPPPGIVPGKSARRNPAVPPTAVNEPVPKSARKPLDESFEEITEPASEEASQPTPVDEDDDVEVLTNPEVVESDTPEVDDDARSETPVAASASTTANVEAPDDEDYEVISPQVVEDAAETPTPEPQTPTSEVPQRPADPTEAMQQMDQPEIVTDGPESDDAEDADNEALSALVQALQSSNRNQPRQ